MPDFEPPDDDDRDPTDYPRRREPDHLDGDDSPEHFDCDACLDGTVVCDTCDVCDTRHCQECDPCE